MSMQIRAIVLYNATGGVRTLPFKLNAVNIITGRSRKGKTALSHVIDYCLGRGECLVPKGVIRDTVSWFALHLQFTETQLFIARRNPRADATASPEVHMDTGANLAIPQLASLAPNITVDGLTALLNQMLGIVPNQNIPPAGQTRQPLRATVDHAKFLIFQTQNEIGNESYLFHRQGEPFIPAAIRDTLPYFLGAVADDTIQLRARLRDRKQELQRLNRGQAEAERVAGEGSALAGQLLTEAVVAGIATRPEVNDFESLVGSLRRSQASLASLPLMLPVGASELDRLIAEQSRLRTRMQELQRRLAEARAYNAASDAYSNEAVVQTGRLETIGLLGPGDGGTDTCPLCSSNLSSAVPSVNDLRASLERLQQDMAGLGSRRPRVDEHIVGLETDMAEVRRLMVDNRTQLEAAQASSATDNTEENRRRDYVRGRVSLFLDNLPTAISSNSRTLRIHELTSEIEKIEEQLADESVRAELDSILNRLGKWMTQWAQDLDLEWQPNPYRLDLSLLTVVADTDPRPTRMVQMGGGENWLGCHLIAHMALHRWFSEKNRPVPRFLFLDQLTGVYYPPDSIQYGNEERAKVEAVYKWLFDALAESNYGFQIIIVDHANLDVPWFQSVIVEEWWGEGGLIPSDWIV